MIGCGFIVFNIISHGNLGSFILGTIIASIATGYAFAMVQIMDWETKVSTEESK